MKCLYLLVAQVGRKDNMDAIDFEKFPSKLAGYDLPWLDTVAKSLPIKDVKTMVLGSNAEKQTLVQERLGLSDLKMFLDDAFDGNLTHIMFKAK